MAVSDPARRSGLTRRQVLELAGGATLIAVAGGGIAESASGSGSGRRRTSPRRVPDIGSYTLKPDGPVRTFRSRPDLRPPTVATSADMTLERWGADDPALLFLGPGPVSLKGSQQYGPLIVDRNGTPVWFSPLAPGLQVTNFSSAQYRGEPVLMWWEGKVLSSGYGQGEAVLVDRSYQEVARVQAAGGRWMDLHALALTPQGTALFTCYPTSVKMDLSWIGGPSDIQVLESIIQEVDVATGRLLFEWHALAHIPVDATHEPMSAPYDYLHVNSIQQLPDGNLLISGRHTWAVYKLDRSTGDVIWTLGGKQSNFRMGAGAQFTWQHDVAQPSDGVLTVFDNGTNGPVKSEPQARGLVLDVDESRRTVTLAHAYTTPQRLLPGAMGSVQILPSGRVLVGWGVTSYTSEFDADGTLLFEAALPEGMYTYRSYRLPWTGMPQHEPALAAAPDGQSGSTIVYASWNGATEVRSWEVNAGSRHDQLRPLGIARHHGFETAIPLRAHARYASVTALDRAGNRLRRSPVIQL